MRSALVRAVAAGVSGSLDVLAEHTGWPPESVRNAVREMRRTGELAMTGRHARTGGGQSPGVYAAAPECEQLDALSFLSAAWR